MWQNDLISRTFQTYTNDRELFTFFKFCYRDGSTEYEEEFNKMWGKRVGQCSNFAPVSAGVSSAADSDESGDDSSSGQDMSR